MNNHTEERPSDATLHPMVGDMHRAHFNRFEQELVNARNASERNSEHQSLRQKQRYEFMESIGTDMEKFNAAFKQDNRDQEARLKGVLDEFRPNMAGRSRNSDFAEGVKLQREVRAEAGHTILPVHASAIIAGNVGQLADEDKAGWTDGAIAGGWVWPADPSQIKIKDTRHYPNALCWDNRQNDPPVPEFASYFYFTPDETTMYEMTAVFGFHGFYILQCDDSWWNCRNAGVKLTTQMDVYQYASAGWIHFTCLHVSKDNVDEIVSHDRTEFFPYTTGLRGGDPVTVVVRGTVLATAHGGGAYAELNFADEAANYIEPLFCSVAKL